MEDCRGLTLIELVITMAIIGILLGVASINHRSAVNDAVLEATAHRIAQDIRLTQQLALANKRDYCFEIYIREKYYIIRPSDPTKGAFKREYIDPHITLSVIGFDKSYDDSYLRKLVYNPAGTPFTTGTIILTNSSGKKKEITVMVGTGRVRIY